jgi:hypothetical protein
MNLPEVSGVEHLIEKDLDWTVEREHRRLLVELESFLARRAAFALFLEKSER